MKKNCWEYKKCGREYDGEKSAEYGVCPASIDMRFDGMNDGKNAGRYCWKVAGTFCGGEVQGTFAQKFKDCLKCKFFKEVVNDEKLCIKI
ncbi:MAG: two-CW domain-containing protein [Peptococcaceae bacterium]